VAGSGADEALSFSTKFETGEEEGYAEDAKVAKEEALGRKRI